MLAILTFHAIEADGSLLSIAPDSLRSLLAAILHSGHAIVPLRTLLEGGHPNNDAVALTFDDGALSVAEYAAPILLEFGAPATLFLTTGFVGGRNTWPSQPATAPVFPMLDWDAIGSLQDASWSIEAHTISHPDLRHLDDATLDAELALPAEVIEQRTGHRPRILAYPYGHFNARVVARSQRYYDYAVTTQFRCLRPNGHRYLVPRLDSYYLRFPRIHKRFGNGASFTTYLNMVSWLRKWRGRPGEWVRDESR